jgi:hypothetical protein
LAWYTTLHTVFEARHERTDTTTLQTPTQHKRGDHSCVRLHLQRQREQYRHKHAKSPLTAPSKPPCTRLTCCPGRAANVLAGFLSRCLSRAPSSQARNTRFRARCAGSESHFWKGRSTSNSCCQPRVALAAVMMWGMQCPAVDATLTSTGRLWGDSIRGDSTRGDLSRA